MEPPECGASSVPSPEYFRNHNCNIGRVKSFVDDLRKERGIVSMRVVFALRSAEIKPSLPRFVHHFFRLSLETRKKGPSNLFPLWEGYFTTVVVGWWGLVYGGVFLGWCVLSCVCDPESTSTFIVF